MISCMGEAEAFLDIPDSMTPVYGYRAWDFSNTHHGIDFPLVLRNISPGRRVWWDSTSWTFASCQEPASGMWAGQRRCPGPVPQIDCECGLYAYHHSIRITPWVGRYVVGAVIGQGMGDYGVIRHGREGWRAEMAKPIAFVRPHTNKQNAPPGRPNTIRYYGNLAKEVPGVIERLAYRLEARLFNTIEDMDDWVKHESGYECFWSKEDEAAYHKQFEEDHTP